MKKKRKKYLYITCAILLFLIGSYIYLMFRPITLRIPLAQIQIIVDSKFPVYKSKNYFRFTFLDPDVSLKKGSNRIYCSVKVITKITRIDGQFNGRAKISGHLKYYPHTGTLFIKNVSINSLTFNDMPRIYNSMARKMASPSIKNEFEKKPIYKLKNNNILHRTIKLLLRNMYIRNGRLYVVLGF